MKVLINFILLYFIIFSSHVLAVNESEAEAFIVGIGNQAIKILKIPVDDKQKRKNELQALLKEKFDMQLISKVIIGKEITSKSSDSQLKKFAEVFELHIVNVYSSQLGTYKGQTFSVNKTELRKKDAFVYTTIESPDYPTTNIVWRVRKRDDIPKVIDMQVEGVSLLRTKRMDFANTLNSYGLDALISKLEDMNKMPDLKIPGE
tara:strand:- start:260 stop:871 length:612 start_codon:yes stop_codon:yes gene_type:complete